MSQESDLQQLRGQAVAAYQQGRTTFVARLKSSVWNPPMGEMTAWMDSIDAVEGAGWELYAWSTGVGPDGSFSALPLFRRPPTASPQDRR
jgi:hypothetical protein